MKPPPIAAFSFLFGLGVSCMPSWAGPASKTEAEQASVRFHKAQTCLLARRLHDFFIHAVRIDPATEARYKQEWAKLPPESAKVLTRNQDLARNVDALCAGLDIKRGDWKIQALALAAARAGDTAAASCYVYAGFEMPEAMSEDPQERARYLVNATAFVDQGIRRGDWRFVDILWLVSHGNVGTDAVDPSWRFMLSTKFPAGEAYHERVRNTDSSSGFRYSRLKQLGATKEFSAELQGYMDGFAAKLTAGEQTLENSAAEDMYHRYFAHSPRRNGKENDICEL